MGLRPGGADGSGAEFVLIEDRQNGYKPLERAVSLLLHIIGNMILYSVLAVIVLALLTWMTKSKGEQKPPSLTELPEDKGTRLNRISAGSYSSSRQDLKNEQEKRRA